MISLPFPADVIERLGWVLVHSLWQFAAIAIAALVAEHALRGRTATIRYSVLLFALAAMAAAPALTWMALQETFPAPVIASEALIPNVARAADRTAIDRAPRAELPAAPIDLQKSSIAAVAPAPEKSLFEQIQSWGSAAAVRLRPWLAHVVTLWLAGVAFFSLRPIVSWRTVRRLRTTGTAPVSDSLQKTLERTVRRLHLKRAVQVLQSTLVHAPVVVGHFRPLVLFPVSAATGLSPSQWEAVLAHELAHIRRHDYLANLAQTIVETVFFYHPAVWWLSARIRQERENCCDDLAAAALGDRVEYGRALLALAELRGACPTLAVGARGGSFLDRIRRLLEREPVKPTLGAANIAGFALVAGAIVAALVWTETLTAVDPEPKEPRKAQEEKSPLGNPFPMVVGRVVTPEGQPASGIEVLAFQGTQQLEEKFTTDDRGEFRVPKAWRESESFLAVVARDGRERIGWFDFYVHLHSGGGQRTADGSFQIELLPINRTVRGSLVDEAGRPAANVPVRVEFLQHGVNHASTHWNGRRIGDEGLLPSATTDDEGRFELNLPADTFAWLRAEHDDWMEQRIRVAKTLVELGETRLTPAAKVAGRVVDSRTGEPVPGIGVAAQSIEPDLTNGGWGDAKTDENGRYEIGGLAAGKCNLFVLDFPEKTLTAPAAAGVELESGETHLADFSLIVGQRLAGRVIDAETGEPLADCDVGYIGPARPRLGAAVLTSTTNDKGEFEFFVPPGDSHLYIADVRETVPESSLDVDVPADRDPAPVILKAGPKSKDGIKIFLGEDKPPRAEVARQPDAAVPPKLMHIPGHERSAVAWQAGEKVHFVLYAQGFLQTGLEQSFAQEGKWWQVRGHINLLKDRRPVRRFEIRHSSAEPDTLYLDGKAYAMDDFAKANSTDGVLRSGRLFVLREKGEPLHLDRTLPLKENDKLDPKDTGSLAFSAERDLYYAETYAASIELASREGWVIAWDTEHPIQHSDGARVARLRVFPDGRVAAWKGLREPLVETRIPKGEVTDLVNWLIDEQGAGARKPMKIKREDGTTIEAPLDPLLGPLWDQEAERVAIQRGGQTYDLMSITPSRADRPEPTFSQSAGNLSDEVRQRLAKLVELAAAGEKAAPPEDAKN